MPHRIVSHSGTSSLSPGASSLPSRPITVPPITAHSRAEIILGSCSWSGSAAEADLARGAVTELDVRELGDGDDDATALGVLQVQHALAGDGVGDELLHGLGALVDVDRQFPGGVLDADLDLHEVLLGSSLDEQVGKSGGACGSVSAR